MKNACRVVTVACLGAVAGAAAGILAAPDKGDKTRKKLNDELQKAKKDLQELVEKGKDTLGQFNKT